MSEASQPPPSSTMPITPPPGRPVGNLYRAHSAGIVHDASAARAPSTGRLMYGCTAATRRLSFLSTMILSVYGFTTAVRFEIAGTTIGVAGMVTLTALEAAEQLAGTIPSHTVTLNVWPPGGSAVVVNVATTPD